MSGLPVLMYHSVADDPLPSTRRLSVPTDAFAAQLSLLRSEGFATMTFSELADAVRRRQPLPPRTVALTFDDGYADFHDVVLPLLARYGCTATVFVTTGWLADARDRRAGRPPGRMLTWRQVQEAASAGIEIGAHTHSHPELDQISDRAVEWELRSSKALLEDELGRPVPTLAYPFGYWSPRVHDAVGAAGYRSAAAVANTTVTTGHDVLALPRLTIRRSTSLKAFGQVLHARHVTRTFLIDRTLTAGWAVLRHARSAIRGSSK
jgi:peptidoglycan/xylan/chitin deacetylase (PgdA/CDA1 family)